MKKFNLPICLIALASSCNNMSREINFEAGEWINIKAANNIAGYCIIDEQVYGAMFCVSDTLGVEHFLKWYQSELYPLAGSDAETFEVCVNSDHQPYGRDANNVYYPRFENTIFIDGEYFGGEIYVGNIIINRADPKTFKYLGKGYAVDKNSMYYEGIKIEWNDSIIEYLKYKV